jgi:Peptidase family M48
VYVSALPGRLGRLRAALPVILAISFFLPAPHLDARVELQPCKNNIPPQQQIELGQKVAKQVYEQMPVLPDSSPATLYVQSLGRKLAAEAPGYKWPFNFHVVNVADINAFALPGGAIFVNLGTVQAAENEAQLAAVLGHEISHVVLQHSVCNAEKQQRVGLIAGLGQLAAGVLLGDTAGQVAQRGIGLTAGLGFLKMSREAERQADLLGVGTLYDAGYDPHAMPQFFETIQRKYGKGSAQFLSDHPNPGNRTEYVDQEIATFVPRSHYISDTPEFVRVHNQVAGMHAYTAQEVASGVWKTQQPNQTVSTGVNQLGASGEPTASQQQSGSVDSSTPTNWRTVDGSDFSLQIPGNWTAVGNASAAMIAPSGCITSGRGGVRNLVCGLLTDVYRPRQQMPLDQSFDALMSELVRDNPGLQPGRVEVIRAGNMAGRSVESENQSGGNGRGEHDWIVGFQNNGSLRYFVFVAPTPAFATLRPTFDQILRSITFR